jgi:hypothetical protein
MMVEMHDGTSLPSSSLNPPLSTSISSSLILPNNKFIKLLILFSFVPIVTGIIFYKNKLRISGISNIIAFAPFNKLWLKSFALGTNGGGLQIVDLGIITYVGYPIGIIIIGLCLWLVLLGIISICQKSS